MTLRSFTGIYTVELVRAHPSTIFLFGDNLVRAGMAGQACIRQEPNAFGIPTKRSPSMHDFAFFKDDDPTDQRAVQMAVQMALALAERFDVVVPVNNVGQTTLGLGLSQLVPRAPNIWGYIDLTLQPREPWHA